MVFRPSLRLGSILPHLLQRPGFLFLDLHPPAPHPPSTSAPRPHIHSHTHKLLTHNNFVSHTTFVTQQLCHTHTQLCHTHTQLCNIATLSHTTFTHRHNLVTQNRLSHTQLCHIQAVSHTHTQLCHTQLWSHTHTQLCHITFTHTQLCHTHNLLTWWRPPAFRVPGVALGDIHRRFAWQAWYLWDWAGLSWRRVPRGTFTWQVWHLGTSIVAFTWQAWHLVTSTFVMGLGWLWWRAWISRDAAWRRGTLRGRRGAWWHPPFVSRGRRGTWWHPPSFCFLWQGLATYWDTPGSGHTRTRASGVTHVTHALLCVAGVASWWHPPSLHVAGLALWRHPPIVLCGRSGTYGTCHTHLFVTHNFVTHHLLHTILPHTTFVTHHLGYNTSFIFHTQLLWHTLSSTHIFVTHHLSHTSLLHINFHTQLCHTPSFTHIFVAHTHTQLCHTHNFVTHHLFHRQIFVTHHLSHTSWLHTIFHTHTSQLFHTHLCHTPSFTHTHNLFTYNLFTHRSSTTSFVYHSIPVPLESFGRSWLVGLSGPLINFFGYGPVWSNHQGCLRITMGIVTTHVIQHWNIPSWMLYGYCYAPNIPKDSPMGIATSPVNEFTPATWCQDTGRCTRPSSSRPPPWSSPLPLGSPAVDRPAASRTKESGV